MREVYIFDRKGIEDFIKNKEDTTEYKRVFEKGIETKPTFIVNVVKDPRLEVLDGKQRITTLFELIENKLILWNNKRFNDLSIEDKKIFCIVI